MTIAETLPLAQMAAFALAAATLLPLSSEVVLLAMLKAQAASPVALVVAASAGNVAGSLVNWWLGRNLHQLQGRRWFPFAPGTIERAAERYRRWGVWSLAFAWVPLVGDPLTVAAGLLRVPLRVFVPLVATGKVLRYVAVAGGWGGS